MHLWWFFRCFSNAFLVYLQCITIVNWNRLENLFDTSCNTMICDGAIDISSRDILLKRSAIRQDPNTDIRHD